VPFGDPAQRPLHRIQLAMLWNQAGDYRESAAVADAVRAEFASRLGAYHWQLLKECYLRSAELARKDEKLPLPLREKTYAHCRAESFIALMKAAAARSGVTKTK
jgi:hypothetical protein